MEIEREIPEGPLTYLATAQATDEEMAERIQNHRLERGPRFTTVEEPLSLGSALQASRAQSAGVVVDCLTVWLGNLLWLAPTEQPDAWIEGQILALEEALREPGCPVWVVTNEVGLGIVPDNALARRYRDLSGRLNQRVAARADRVSLLVCGIPMRVKG